MTQNKMLVLQYVAIAEFGHTFYNDDTTLKKYNSCQSMINFPYFEHEPPRKEAEKDRELW